MSLPFPVVLEPSGIFLGIDGNWSTWSVWVGTPLQQFYTVPSTSSGEVWVPVPEGCDSTGCAVSRGVVVPQDAHVLGFQNNVSSTWDQIGTFELLSGGDLFHTAENGLYGLDTVSVGNKETQIAAQIVAGIATSDFWLGSFGLTRSASDFPTRSEEIPSLLDTMRSQNLTPSASFGYAAGASYDSFAGSLVIGGYDQNMMQEAGVEIPVKDNQSRPLVASVQSIVATNTLNGTISYTHEKPSISMAIDSAVSQLWLPASMCEQLSESLNLTYDSSTGLYLVSDATRDVLLDLSPEFTITLAANAESNRTVNIVFPYTAFDLQIDDHLTFNNRLNYFPIRQAANDSLFILGRAFLQEAYVVVDWERGNFTIGPRTHDLLPAPRIVPILPVAEDLSESSSLGSGVIAGIAVGSCAAVIGVAMLVYFLWWKRRKHTADEEIKSENGPVEFYVDEKKVDGAAELETTVALLPEAASTPLQELHEDQLRHQLMSNPVYELLAEREDQELEASTQPSRRASRKLNRGGKAS